MRSTSLFETHIHIFSENSPSPHWIETVNEVFSSKGYFEVAYPPTQLGTYAIVTLEEWMDDNPSWQAVPGRNGKYFDYSSEQHYVVAWIRSRVDWALAEGSIELIGLLEEGHCPELGSDPDPTAKKVEGQRERLPDRISDLGEVEPRSQGCYRKLDFGEGYVINHGDSCPGCQAVYSRLEWIENECRKENEEN